MKSQEIRDALEDSKTEKGWVKELCYQVAISNEHHEHHTAQLQAVIDALVAIGKFPDSVVPYPERRKRKYVRKSS